MNTSKQWVSWTVTGHGSAIYSQQSGIEVGKRARFPFNASITIITLIHSIRMFAINAIIYIRAYLSILGRGIGSSGEAWPACISCGALISSPYSSYALCSGSWLSPASSPGPPD